MVTPAGTLLHPKPTVVRSLLVPTVAPPPSPRDILIAYTQRRGRCISEHAQRTEPPGVSLCVHALHDTYDLHHSPPGAAEAHRLTRRTRLSRVSRCPAGYQSVDAKVEGQEWRKFLRRRIRSEGPRTVVWRRRAMLLLREYGRSVIICCHLVLAAILFVFGVLFAIVYLNVVDCHGAIWPLSITYLVGVGSFLTVILLIEGLYWLLLGGTLHDPSNQSGEIHAWTSRIFTSMNAVFVGVILGTDLVHGAHYDHLIIHQQAYHIAAMACFLNATTILVFLYHQMQTDYLARYILPSIIASRLGRGSSTKEYEA